MIGVAGDNHFAFFEFYGRELVEYRGKIWICSVAAEKSLRDEAFDFFGNIGTGSRPKFDHPRENRALFNSGHHLHFTIEEAVGGKASFHREGDFGMDRFFCNFSDIHLGLELAHFFEFQDAEIEFVCRDTYGGWCA